MRIVTEQSSLSDVFTLAQELNLDTNLSILNLRNMINAHLLIKMIEDTCQPVLDQDGKISPKLPRSILSFIEKKKDNDKTIPYYLKNINEILSSYERIEERHLVLIDLRLDDQMAKIPQHGDMEGTTLYAGEAIGLHDHVPFNYKIRVRNNHNGYSLTTHPEDLHTLPSFRAIGYFHHTQRQTVSFITRDIIAYDEERNVSLTPPYDLEEQNLHSLEREHDNTNDFIEEARFGAGEPVLSPVVSTKNHTKNREESAKEVVEAPITQHSKPSQPIGVKPLVQKHEPYFQPDVPVKVKQKQSKTRYGNLAKTDSAFDCDDIHALLQDPDPRVQTHRVIVEMILNKDLKIHQEGSRRFYHGTAKTLYNDTDIHVMIGEHTAEKVKHDLTSLQGKRLRAVGTFTDCEKEIPLFNFIMIYKD